MSEKNKVLQIIKKVEKRYTETYKNSIILVHPNVKWNILFSSNKLQDVQDEMKKLFHYVKKK